MDSPVLHIFWLAAAGGITLILPGAALLAWLPSLGMDLPQQLGRALGLSMALTALGALVTFLTGLRLTAAGLIAIYAAFLLFGIAGWLWRQRKNHTVGENGVFLDLPENLRSPQTTFPWPSPLVLSLTLLIGIGLLVWRFYQARGLVLPVWVDSLHHVLIVRAILDRGGLPASLAPYLPVPFYYHFGFHVVGAVFSFWSRLTPDQAVLILGQVLEAAMSLAAYRLAAALWPRRQMDRFAAFNPRGLAAALLVGLVTHMPGYYLTWGRYTLLAGMVLLALAMAEAINIRSKVGGSVLVLAFLTTGVLLTHYLVAVILALFLVLLAAPILWSDLRSRHLSMDQWLPLVGGVALGTLLAAPWLTWVISHALSSFSLKVVLPAQAGGQDYINYLWYLAGPQRNYWLLLAAGLGLLMALRRRETRVFAIWSAIFGLLCMPAGVRLGPLRPDIVVMMIFLPEVVLAGDLLISAGEAVSLVSRRRVAGVAAAGLALSLLCAWGLHETGDIVNPVTVIATQADRQALTWIDKNLPADARFYINTTLWQGVTYRGVDSGWWILPLTGRQTLVPPVVYAWGAPDYVALITDWATKASRITSCTAEFWGVVHASGMNYIYVHAGIGALQPSGLSGCAGITSIYQVEGVDIYSIQP